MIHFLYVWLGLSNASGSQYLFWSGFFGDITILAAGIGLYFHHVCHDEKCHRWGRHKADGSPYCKKHKPVAQGVQLGQRRDKNGRFARH